MKIQAFFLRYKCDVTIKRKKAKRYSDTVIFSMNKGCSNTESLFQHFLLLLETSEQGKMEKLSLTSHLRNGLLLATCVQVGCELCFLRAARTLSKLQSFTEVTNSNGTTDDSNVL